MNNYIFITDEGYTYQPGSESVMPDIENLQVIGYASGKSAEEAFENLLNNNKYLRETSFDEVVCYKLSNDYKDTRKIFYIQK